MFILPKKVIEAVEQKCFAFLWTGSSEKAIDVNVSWSGLSLPKWEGRGGLEIKKIEK